MSANHISDKGLAYRIYKELVNLSSKKKKKIQTQLGNGPKTWADISLKRTYSWISTRKDGHHH